MIFRGDGKNNMEEGNCFLKHINKYTVESNHISGEYIDKTPDNEENNNPLITKVLMNPPFSLKKRR